MGTEALDLSVGAAGLVLEIDMHSPVELVPASRTDGPAEAVAVSGVLIVPSRPGTLLEHAEQRSVGVSRD